MKNLALLLVLAISIGFASCGPAAPYPAEDCFFSYTFLGTEYRDENIEFYSGLEAGNLLINHNFDNGGNLRIISNDWDETTGEVPATFFLKDADGTNFYPNEGTINITVLEDKYYSGTFIDGDGLIENGTFTLRYGTL